MTYDENSSACLFHKSLCPITGGKGFSLSQLHTSTLSVLDTLDDKPKTSYVVHEELSSGLSSNVLAAVQLLFRSNFEPAEIESGVCSVGRC